MNIRERRRLVWAHNGFRGSARMMQTQATSIMRSATATDEAKAQAAVVQREAVKLYELLETRRPFPEPTNEDQ